MKYEKNINLLTALCLMFFVSMVYTDLVFATADNAISDVLCVTVNWFTGPIGKAIATLAIVAMGIGLFLGKISWPLALTTALGIGLIFGASAMVTTLTDQDTSTLCQNTGSKEKKQQ